MAYLAGEKSFDLRSLTSKMYKVLLVIINLAKEEEEEVERSVSGTITSPEKKQCLLDLTDIVIVSLYINGCTCEYLEGAKKYRELVECSLDCSALLEDFHKLFLKHEAKFSTAEDGDWMRDKSISVQPTKDAMLKISLAYELGAYYEAKLATEAVY